MWLSTGTLCKAIPPVIRFLAGTFKWTQVFPKISHKLPFMLLKLTHQTHQFLSKDTIVSVFCAAFNFRHVPWLCASVCAFDINTNARISSKQLVRHPIDITWSCFDRYNRFSQFQLWRFSSFYSNVFTRSSLVSHNFYWWWLQKYIENCNAKIIKFLYILQRSLVFFLFQQIRAVCFWDFRCH